MSTNGKKIEVINYPLPGTDKQVPIQMGDVKAAPGHFLAIAAVFEDWYDAQHSGYDQSRIFNQLVGARIRPCYMFDCPFEHPEWSRIATRLHKAYEKKEAKRQQDLSLEGFIEDGYDPSSETDTTSGEVLGKIMREEFLERLEKRDNRLIAVNNLREQGLTAKEISEVTGIPMWTVYDLLKRCKAELLRYWNNE